MQENPVNRAFREEMDSRVRKEILVQWVLQVHLAQLPHSIEHKEIHEDHQGQQDLLEHRERKENQDYQANQDQQEQTEGPGNQAIQVLMVNLAEKDHLDLKESEDQWVIQENVVYLDL